MMTTLNIRSLGHICTETGIPYELVRKIVKAKGIRPAIVDNGCPKFDDAAFEQIVTAHAAMAGAGKIATSKGPRSSGRTQTV